MSLKLEKVEKLVVESQKESLATPTPTDLATICLNGLPPSSNIQFSPDHRLPAVLTMEQQDQLTNQRMNEHALVKFLTPYFQNIFHDWCVVNSEEFAWLETQGHKQKPDLFLIPLCNAMKKTLTCEEERGQTDPRFLFGVPADCRIKDTVQIFDAKCDNSMKGYGEHIIHLQHMKYASHMPVRGMYFGKLQCWLSICCGNELIYREVLNWTDGGSAGRLKAFFQHSLWDKVDEVAKILNYKIFNPFQNNTLTSAFLGKGGTGRVYAVVKNDVDLPSVRQRDLYAMKVVNSQCDLMGICAEFLRIRDHQVHCGCDLIVKICCNKCVEYGSLCGYVMGPVGISVNRSMLKRGIGDILNALYRLHAHSPPIIHGDPRLANLLLISSDPVKFCWIDLFHTVFGEVLTDLKAKDMRNLVRSIFGSDDLPSEIVGAIDQYGQTCNEESLQALITLV